jgi:phosphomannomutase
VIGGEGNGGVILPDVHHTRDAAVAAALVLQLMLEDRRKLSEIVADATPYAIVKDKLPRGESRDLRDVYAKLEAELGAPDVDLQDGLRLSWPDEKRWLHFRPSGTEPILRIIAEAPNEKDARAMVERARAAL